MKVTFTVFLMAVGLTGFGCQSAEKSRSSPASAPGPVRPAPFPEPRAKASQDFAITNQVEASLSEAGMQDLRVKSIYGEVVLCGYVSDQVQKRRAEQIAGSIEGVVKVNNYITVGNKPPVNTNKPGGPRQKLCDF